MAKRKLNSSTVKKVRKMVASGTQQKCIALEYKLSEGTVSKIVNYKRYK